MSWFERQAASQAWIQSSQRAQSFLPDYRTRTRGSNSGAEKDSSSRIPPAAGPVARGTAAVTAINSDALSGRSARCDFPCLKTEFGRRE